MTVKEFAALCSCSTQTLRYYDRIDLLKPISVDPWSGYRYYDAAQAIDFVKIKNLQAADFSIEEIKGLLTKPDQEIYDAFTAKIAAQEQKLARILEIQKTYLKEKSSMENIIHNLSEFLLNQLSDHEALREFGLHPEDGPKIVSLVKGFFETQMQKSAAALRNVTLVVDDDVFHGEDEVATAIRDLREKDLPETILLGNEALPEESLFDPKQHTAVWEIHGWNHVYEFIDEIPALEDDGDYTFLFRLNEESYREDIAFPMYMMGAMMLKKGEAKVYMGCAVERSDDSSNHFALMQRR